VTGISTESRRRVSRARRGLGVLLFVLSVVALVVYVLAVWNPRRLVWLSYYFGSPPIGVAVVMGLLCVGSWLAFPIRSEAVDNRRIMFRLGTGLGALAGLIAWGVIGPVFARQITVLARAPEQDRTVAVVERSDRSRQLHVWSGKGLFARDAGSLGPACGDVRVRFLSHDRILMNTSYGDWQIDLAPATGAPRQVLGPRCADAPGPTLDR
jgi:hypothetical protein